MDYPKNAHSPPPQQKTEQHQPTNPTDPWTSPLRRNIYHRQSSLGTIRFADEIQQDSLPAASMDVVHQVEMDPVENHSNALGINTSGRPVSISRVPVGSRAGQTPPTPSKAFFSNLKSPSRTAPPLPSSISPYFSSTSSQSPPQTPGSSKGLLSPLQSSELGTYAFDRGGLTPTPEQENFEHDISKGKQPMFTENSNSTYDAKGYPEREYDRDERFVYGQENGSNGNFNGNDNDKASLLDGCPAKHDIYSSRNSWLSVSLLILSLYSTVFSGIYLVIAIVQPRYGQGIHTGGRLPPSIASTLFTMVAKTIELSFVTVFVTFLGQVLSRRSLVKASRGVTIAELTMRTWVIQPGFMITHWQTLRHAGLTILGVITMTAALIAMFYTTASDALVSPHLKYGSWQNKLMDGLVMTSYADAKYLAETCQTPVSTEIDPDYSGTTCLSILHVGQAQHNFVTFLDKWKVIHDDGEGISSDLSQRPQAPALIFDNTTVTGSWILTETSNVTAAYSNHSRIINNVTMAMPHAGVIAAAHQEQNAILQPEELDGVGEYAIKAAVVSPSINVLCANMHATELEPLIYNMWPNSTNASPDQLAQLGHAGYEEGLTPVPPSKFLNTTVVDDIFEWGETYNRQPPIFAKLPMEYNSLVNISATAIDYNFRDSVYLLIKASNVSTQDYTMCRIRSFLSSDCSTRYNVSGKTGGKLISKCEDPSDGNAYHRSHTDADTHMVVNAPDWRDVGSTWMTALALGTGISNANASISRLLSQLVVVEKEDEVLPKLDPLMPSLAESLAVLAGSTLLISSTDATFDHSWNSSKTILKGTQMSFNASLASQEYTSGPTQNWQSIFYLVLLLVFFTNVFCLIYFIMRAGLVTDYTEPQNLFALAVNSPPSRHLEGSCGTGPEGDQFNVDWHVSQEDASGHFFIKNGPKRMEKTKSFLGLRMRTGKPKQLKHESSYSMLSSGRKSWL